MTTRVLIVDDHAIVRGGLSALLATADDLEVVGAAADADEAVRLAGDEQPDVVLMDLSMPGRSGVEATAAVLAVCPSTHVLVLTSYSERTWVTAALEAGAEGYLLKQSEPETILAGIRAVLAGGAPLDPKAARVLLTSRRDPADPPADALTAREEEVLGMVGEGLANRAIARRLGITERTVKAHLTHVYQRIGVTDRTQAALWVHRRDRRPDLPGGGY